MRVLGLFLKKYNIEIKRKILPIYEIQSADEIVSFSKDGKTIAEEIENRNFTEKDNCWLNLAEWLKSKED